MTNTPTSTSQTFGAWLLNVVEQDLAGTAGKPFVALLTSLEAHAGNKLLQGADVLQFVATAPAAGIMLEVELEQQLLGAVLAKVNAAIASKAPVVPAAA